MNGLKLVGVLNITPDSFSDGRSFYNNPHVAVDKALKFIEEGAALVDVGADSTRPESMCVGPEEEWVRLRPVLELLSKEDIPFAVDTHHAEVAKKAIQLGALMINDVSAGADLNMLNVIASSEVKYVVMYSRCNFFSPDAKHTFLDEEEGDIIGAIRDFFVSFLSKAKAAGIDQGKLILDPGMGKFISDDPKNSWQVIRNLKILSSLACPLYLGISRKGFLALPGEGILSDADKYFERDLNSAVAALIAIRGLASDQQLYVRTHNIAAHRKLMNSMPFFI
jgi:dihydropteroate synthase